MELCEKFVQVKSYVVLMLLKFYLIVLVKPKLPIKKTQKKVKDDSLLYSIYLITRNLID